MLSLGLDPEKSTPFVQSDVPETTELAWLLSTVTPMGWLEKCVSYKDKIEQGLPAEHGLFAYPALQAADILLYDADLVPVGQDQKQHLEITRDIAERVNRVYGGGHRCVPAAFQAGTSPRVGGRGLRASTAARCPRATTTRSTSSTTRPMIRWKKAKKIVTDSTPIEAPKKSRHMPVVQPLQAFAPANDLADVERRYRREGGIGYGEVKTRLAEAIIAKFGPARAAGRLAGTSRAASPRSARPTARRGESKDHRASCS